jgi:hypothetical protein
MVIATNVFAERHLFGRSCLGEHCMYLGRKARYASLTRVWSMFVVKHSLKRPNYQPPCATFEYIHTEYAHSKHFTSNYHVHLCSAYRHHSGRMTFYMTGLAYVYDSDDDSYYNPSFPCRFCNVPDFSSRKEAAQHEARTHYVCTDCDQRHDSWQDLTQHCRQIGCSFVCTGCHWTGKIWHFDRDGYRRHLEENNVCRDCERHFDTPSNLVHVRVTTYQRIRTARSLMNHSTASLTAHQSTPVSAVTAPSPPTAA